MSASECSRRDRPSEDPGAAHVLAGNDEVVPMTLGRRLYDGYSGPKRLWVQEGSGHNTLDYQPTAAWLGEVSRFLAAGTGR